MEIAITRHQIAEWLKTLEIFTPATPSYLNDIRAKNVGKKKTVNWFRKINNKSHFKVSEIIKLCDILGIVDKDSYFFAEI